MTIRRALAALLVVHLVAGLLLLPPWAVRLQAAYAVVQSFTGAATAGTPTTATTSSATSDSKIDLLVACVASYEEGVDEASPMMSDSKSNTWNDGAATQFLDTGTASQEIRVRMYYSRPTMLGTMHTFTYANSNSTFPALYVLGFSGSVATPLDDTAGATHATATSLATGQVDPTETNELIVACVAHASEATMDVDGGFVTPTLDINSSGGNNVFVGTTYLIQTSIASANPTISAITANMGTAVNIATFKDTPGSVTCRAGLLLTGVGGCR